MSASADSSRATVDGIDDTTLRRFRPLRPALEEGVPIAALAEAVQVPERDVQSFDLLHRREARRPNEIWQANHTELDVLVFDETGAVIRPWLCNPTASVPAQ